jgi:hypothetical protein
LQIAVLGKAGKDPILTLNALGFQGPSGIGMQDMGVKTPSAAVVAAATVGFARDVHILNGKILTMGAKSMTIVACANRHNPCPIAFVVFSQCGKFHPYTPPLFGIFIFTDDPNE